MLLHLCLVWRLALHCIPKLHRCGGRPVTCPQPLIHLHPVSPWEFQDQPSNGCSLPRAVVAWGTILRRPLTNQYRIIFASRVVFFCSLLLGSFLIFVFLIPAYPLAHTPPHPSPSNHIVSPFHPLTWLHPTFHLPLPRHAMTFSIIHVFSDLSCNR